jgi:hypothetical protein
MLSRKVKMPKRSGQTEQTEPAASSGGGRINFIFERRNRGLLLDVVVLFTNVFLMELLVGYFVDVVNAASDGDGIAQAALLAYGLSLLILPPAGAVMKRWHFHQRLKGRDYKETTLAGCLFNPMFYICLVFVIFAVVNAGLLQFLSDAHGDPGPVLFGISMVAGIALTIVHVWLVYRYFSPPKHPPASEFLLSPASDIVGDICLFVNMIFLQIIWNLMSYYAPPHPADVTEFIARLFGICFIALLIYFPPRMLYLAEDINKRRTWLMIFVANLPIILRVLFGTHSIHPIDW